MSTRTTFSVLSLPQAILEAIMDEVLCQSGGAEGALRGLRGTYSKMRAAANARTRRVSTAMAVLRRSCFFCFFFLFHLS